MIELLSGSNDIVWVNPFGPANGPIFPNVYKIKESLTVYYPGINFLALQSLRLLNERRRLLQVVLYLIGRDFEPDMVWVDDPMARHFALHYGRKGARTLFYEAERMQDEEVLAEIRRLAEAVDLTYKPEKLPADISEDDFMAAMEKRLEEIGDLIDTMKAKILV